MSVFTSRTKSIPAQRAEGIRIYTPKTTYIDAIAGIFNLPFGYSNQLLRDAIHEQLDNFAFLPKEQIYDERLLSVSDELLRLTGMGGGAVLVVTDGSDAIEAALALALDYQQAQGRPTAKKFVSFHHSYHGATLGAHTVTGRGGFAEIRHSGYDTIRVFPDFSTRHNGCWTPAWTLEHVEDAIIASGPHTIAGLIVEPTSHLGGMRARSPEYLFGIRQICDRYDIVLIADEIVTGAFRTGPFLNFQQTSVLPDIVALGKGVSGGYVPASAMIANSKITAKFDHDCSWVKYPYSHTYAANPIALAALQSSLKLLQTDEIQASAKRVAERLQAMVLILQDSPKVVRTESNGLLLGLTLAPTLGDHSGRHVEKGCFDRGVIVRGENDWVAIAPAYITENNDLDLICRELRNVINNL